MQAVDPARLVPGGSHPIPQAEAEGSLFEARLAAAFSDEGAGEAPRDLAALGDETSESSVLPAPGPLSPDALVALALLQPTAGDDVPVTGPSPTDVGAEGADGIANDAGRVVESDRGQADSGSTDVRMPMTGRDASSGRQFIQTPVVQEQDSAVGEFRHPQDGELTAATPNSGRSSSHDSPEGRTLASGREASAGSADTAAGVSRPSSSRATAAPSVEEQTTTGPAVPIDRTEPVSADARRAAHAGVDPSGADAAGSPRPRSMEPRFETPVVAMPAAPPPDAATQDAFESDMQRGPGHEPSPASPSAAPRASSPAAPMFFQTAEGLPGTAGTAPGTAAVASYALMSPQDRAENLGRLVQSMRVFVRDGASEATVRLRPEHLGDVSISLRVDGRSVSAVVRAEAASVREWLQTQHDSLRQSLALQGLSLDRLEIEPDGRRDEHNGGADDKDPPRRRSHSVDPDSRFEVLV